MTNTEAFKQAIDLINNREIKYWEEKPFEAFMLPMRTMWMWFRICDYFIVNHKYPKSFRSLHTWEKNYYQDR